MSQSNIIFPTDSISSPGFDRFETLITVKELKERYLHGVDLRDNDGTQMKKSAIEFYIRSAISEIEHDFELTITPTQYQQEPHDYKSDDYYNWGYIQLKNKPIISVEAVQLMITGNQPVVDFDLSWVRLQRMVGQLQIAPMTGSLGTFNIGNVSFLPRLLVWNDTYPSFFRITYTAGFEQDKIPSIINQAIGMKAALQLLSIAGDLIIGAGIANQSIAIDGMSKSVGTTASAMYSGYSARMEHYKKELERINLVFKKYYGKSIKHIIV